MRQCILLAFCIAVGGTVDITAHEILLDGSVKEISPPCGGPWGANTVDKKFVLLLEQMLGRDFITKFKSDQPQQWLQFISSFEKAKRAFKSDGKYSIRVPLPFSFDRDFKKSAQFDIEEVPQKARKEGLSFTNGILTVNHEIAGDFFQNQFITLLTKSWHCCLRRD